MFSHSIHSKCVCLLNCYFNCNNNPICHSIRARHSSVMRTVAYGKSTLREPFPSMDIQGITAVCQGGAVPFGTASYHAILNQRLRRFSIQPRFKILSRTVTSSHSTGVPVFAYPQRHFVFYIKIPPATVPASQSRNKTMLPSRFIFRAYHLTIFYLIFFQSALCLEHSLHHLSFYFPRIRRRDT